MNMKKTLTTIMMMGMLTLTSVSAFAEGNSDNTNGEKTKAAVPQNVITLKEEIKAINENMKSVLESIKERRAEKKEEIKSEAGEIKESIAEKKDENKELREEYSLIKENFEKLKARLTEQAKEAKEAGDTEKLKELKAERDSAITVFKATREDFISKRANFEDEKLMYQNLKEEYKDIKEEAVPYLEAIRERHTQVGTLREEAKSAFSTGDFDAVAEFLTEILALKEANYSDMLMIQSIMQ